MLDKLTREDFAPRAGERFRVEEAGVDLVLAETVGLSAREGNQGPWREPFTLLFRGPKSPVLPQRIYSLEHEALGRLEIFLVPIGPDEDGMRYEAVFN